MKTLIIFIQIIIAVGILNVWILRYRKSTNWRGGDARNMEEEFAVYGLPPWSVRVIGTLKTLFAILLIAGIWFPAVTKPAAVGLSLLMLGAVSMHFKVRDPLQKSLPSLTMLVLCLIVVLF